MGEAVTEPPSSHSIRDRRQQHDGRFDDRPSSPRTIQSLLQHMIASGTQCNVYESPLATPTSAPLTKLANSVQPNIPVRQDIIELAPCGEQMDVTCGPLEVDEDFCGESDDLWLERLMNMRRANMLSSIRKSASLTYRTSADAALRSQNLVRNIPRMRKRKRTGKDKDRSSRGSISKELQPQPLPPPQPHPGSLQYRDVAVDKGRVG